MLKSGGNRTRDLSPIKTYITTTRPQRLRVNYKYKSHNDLLCIDVL